MAANTDPRVVDFANNFGRRMNDLMVSMYESAVVFIEQYNAQGIGTLAPFDANLIVDGSSVNGVDATGGDGRPLMRNQDLEQIFNLASTFQNVVERGTVDTSGTQNFANRTTLLGRNVNGKSIF